MRTKRQFHCQMCGTACTIYKKGKKHRVLVCPNCGVLATNPIAKAKFLRGSLTGATAGATLGSVVPVLGTTAGGIIGGVVGGIADGYESKSEKQAIKQTQPTHPHFTTFEKALLLESLEHKHARC